MSSTRSGNPSSSPQPFEHAGPGSKSQQHTDITGISSAGSNESQDNSLRAVAVELAQDLSMEPLCAHPVKDTQAQIRTVASQIDGVHTQIGQIKDQVPSIHQQTAAIIESAQALEQMYKQIDELAVLVERVAAAAYEANGKVEEAERDLSSTPLQPLQAMLESLKMVLLIYHVFDVDSCTMMPTNKEQPFFPQDPNTSMSDYKESVEKAKESLLALSTSKDIQPSLISDLSTALIASLAGADSDESKSVVRNLQNEFLERCTELLAQPSAKDPATTKGDSIVQVQIAVLKSLLRMVMNDTPFTDALFDSKTYPAILRLSDTAPTPAAEDTKSPPSPTKGKSAQSEDLKPTIIILLSKAFDMASNKDHVRDKSAGIVLADIGSDKIKIRTTGFRALGIIIQADMSIGCGIINKDGLLVELMDCIDSEPENIQISLTETLSMACADAKTRAVVGLHCTEYFKSMVLRGATKNQHLKGAAAVVLTKISLADSQKDPSVGLSGVDDPSQEDAKKGSGTSAEEEAQLAKLFSALLKDDKNDGDGGVQVNAVEGLAYASIQPAVKQQISSDKSLLLSLFRLGEETKSNPLKYGFIIILYNLTTYKKRLTPEQEQMLKLKRMAGTLPNSDARQLQNLEVDDPRDSEAAVNQRNIALVKLGVMPALHAIAQKASDTVRQSVAQVLRNLITPSETRGQLVQQGAVRLLLPMALLQPSETSEPTKTPATQALAKLCITLDPRLTFKNHRTPELVKPLTWLLDSTDQLCQFESLMALTNLGSIGDVEVSGLIVQDGGIEKMENLQFSENTMVRRAATEALCNMIFFEPVFELYSDPQKSKNKIHLMLALCDADDFMTRRAASGALAVLTTNEDVCKMIVAQDRGLEILQTLITLGVPGPKDDKDEVEAIAIEDVMSDQEATVVEHGVAVGRMDELRHRGAECFKNLITIGGKEISQKIVAKGVVQQLVNLVQNSSSEAVGYCAMEALKGISGHGIPLGAQ